MHRIDWSKTCISAAWLLNEVTFTRPTHLDWDRNLQLVFVYKLRHMIVAFVFVCCPENICCPESSVSKGIAGYIVTTRRFNKALTNYNIEHALFLGHELNSAQSIWPRILATGLRARGNGTESQLLFVVCLAIHIGNISGYLGTKNVDLKVGQGKL